MINERETAVYALMDITEGGGYNNLILRDTLRKNGAMTKEQRAFVTELVNSALRNLIHLDYLIDSVSNTKVSKMKPFIRSLLRAAACELKFMRSADYAVISEAVNLAKRKGFTNLSGFVNGVLRNLQRKMGEIPYPDKTAEPAEYFSVVFSYPLWIVKLWIDELGLETTEKILEANASAPEVSVCVNTLKTTTDDLAERLKSEGVSVSAGRLSESALRISKTSDIGKLPSFNTGLFHVMDESAMEAVRMLDPKPGERLLDVCAAPGGKSFFSAYLMKNQGKITSNDIYEHKQYLIEDGAARLAIGIIEATLSDASALESGEQYDAVIVDAPCSGLGLCRRKPDIKYVKKPGDIPELQKLQREILVSSVRMLKPGGRLLYSTCTLTNAENGDNARFIEQELNCEPLESRLILPYEYHSDGFFISIFRKR